MLPDFPADQDVHSGPFKTRRTLKSSLDRLVLIVLITPYDTLYLWDVLGGGAGARGPGAVAGLSA